MPRLTRRLLTVGVATTALVAVLFSQHLQGSSRTRPEMEIAYVNSDSGDISVWIGLGKDAVRVSARNTAAMAPAWAPDGKHLAYVEVRDGPRFAVAVYDWSTRRQKRVVPFGGPIGSVTWSPGGTALLFDRLLEEGGRQQLVLLELDSGKTKILDEFQGRIYGPRSWRMDDPEIVGAELGPDGVSHLTFRRADGSVRERWETSEDYSPAWDPSGERLAFVRAAGKKWSLLVWDCGKSGSPQIMAESKNFIYRPSWLPGGLGLVYELTDEQGSSSLWQVGLPPGSPKRLMGGGGTQASPAARPSSPSVRSGAPPGSAGPELPPPGDCSPPPTEPTRPKA